MECDRLTNYLKAVLRLYIMEAVIRWCRENYLCMGRLETQSIFRAFLFIFVHQKCMAERGLGFDVVIRIIAAAPMPKHNNSKAINKLTSKASKHTRHHM